MRVREGVSEVLHRYSPQFWLMAGGMLLSLAGTSMVWPFFPMYVSQVLGGPLSLVGLLITLQAGAGLVGTVLGGFLVDRWGRKTGMILSLLGMGVAYALLNFTSTWEEFAGTMVLGGLFAPTFRIGGDAMAADLVPPEERDEAYAILRVATNVGLALGPALGALLIVWSYRLAFTGAALVLFAYAFILWVWGQETLPNDDAHDSTAADFMLMVRDRRLWAFLLPVLLAWMAGSLVWVWLGVYMRDYFGLGERYYGWLVTTNAAMVMTQQFLVTRWARRLGSMRLAMVLGALLYAGAITAMAWAATFWEFWVLMVVLTVGEMLMIPTASTWVANLAPEQLRGRYMSTIALMWVLGAGSISPIGGWLSDNVSPQAPWYAGGALALLAAVLFLFQEPPETHSPKA